MIASQQNIRGPLVLWRNGAIVRALLTTLLLAAVAFLGTMAVLISGDQWLECTRQQTGFAACALRVRYPLGVGEETVLPTVLSARTERRVPHNYREMPHVVLMLQHEAQPDTEHPGVGKLGERAGSVAGEISAFLAGSGEKVCRWQFREAAPEALSFGMLGAALLALALVPCSFQRVRVSYAPGRREVTVRVGRWPLPPRRWACPLDGIECVEISETTNQLGAFYGVRVRPAASAGAGSGCPGDLPHPVGHPDGPVSSVFADTLGSGRRRSVCIAVPRSH